MSKEIQKNNDQMRIWQGELVPIVQQLFEKNKICFSSVFAKPSEDGNSWIPKENIAGNFLHTFYNSNPDWVVDMSKKIADDYQIVIEEYFKQHPDKKISLIEEGEKHIFESLEKWSKTLIERENIKEEIIQKIKDDFENIIKIKGEYFFGFVHGNIISDHTFIGENKIPYLLGMRIVSRPGRGYYDFLRAIDWLILKVDKDEEKFEKILGWMKKYLANYDWEGMKLVFALRCIGIFGWDMLHLGDYGSGNVELKRKMLVRFIKREY